MWECPPLIRIADSGLATGVPTVTNHCSTANTSSPWRLVTSVGQADGSAGLHEVVILAMPGPGPTVIQAPVRRRFHDAQGRLATVGARLPVAQRKPRLWPADGRPAQVAGADVDLDAAELVMRRIGVRVAHPEVVDDPKLPVDDDVPAAGLFGGSDGPYEHETVAVVQCADQPAQVRLRVPVSRSPRVVPCTEPV